MKPHTYSRYFIVLLSLFVFLLPLLALPQVAQSSFTPITSNDPNGEGQLFLPLVTNPPPPMSLVSVASNGTQANSNSDLSSISANGRYVAFRSDASNLVGDDTNNINDIFVHDQKTGQTSRVSVASDGLQSNGWSEFPSISANGRYVAFNSFASNLVNGDTNQYWDIFVHDRITAQTRRVSVASGGMQGDSDSFFPSISANGRFVAFHSRASNLVSGDTNGNSDIFVHDQQTGQTSRVSVASGGIQAAGWSESPSISADGRYVSFNSSASNLVSGDTNSYTDIFVHDRQTGLTNRVSTASDGTQANNESSSVSSISADGRYIAFESFASNLVSGNSNDETVDVFVHDQQTGLTTQISVSPAGMRGNDVSISPSISADGRYVAFNSRASNLVSGDTNNAYDIFLRDSITGQTSRITVDANGTQGNLNAGSPSISANGFYVAFYSASGNLVSGDTNFYWDIFVHYRGN